jgi:hypothetical protein
MEEIFQKRGRVHFDVGGAGAVEDVIKLVRNCTHKNAGFAFNGWGSLLPLLLQAQAGRLRRPAEAFRSSVGGGQ